VVRYQKPKDLRSAPERWVEAVESLADILTGYEIWRENIPSGAADSPTAKLINEMLDLRDLVDQLAAAELPRGSGRD
jgi:hypothetical protein